MLNQKFFNLTWHTFGAGKYEFLTNISRRTDEWRRFIYLNRFTRSQVKQTYIDKDKNITINIADKVVQ